MRWPFALAILLLVAGCDGAIQPDQPPRGEYPAACGAWGFSPHQCRSVVSSAARQASVDLASQPKIEFLRFTVPGGTHFGRGQIANVLFTFADGRTIEQPVRCNGASFLSPACNPDAEIFPGFGVNHDVPCSGEPPVGCATLPPTPDASAIARARSLKVAEFSAEIDHLGRFEAKVGTATLADGYLFESRFELADPSPENYWLEFINLEVRSDAPGRPPVNTVYRDPYDGPEPVSIYVVFEVTEYWAPSKLVVRNLVVR